MRREFLAVAAVLCLGGVALAQSLPINGGSGCGSTPLPSNILTGALGSATIDFGAISPSSASEAGIVPVAGAEVGQLAQCSATTDLEVALLLAQWVSGTGEVSITLYNPSSFSAVDLPPTEFSCVVFSSP